MECLEWERKLEMLKLNSVRGDMYIYSWSEFGRCSRSGPRDTCQYLKKFLANIKMILRVHASIHQLCVRVKSESA